MTARLVARDKDKFLAVADDTRTTHRTAEPAVKVGAIQRHRIGMGVAEWNHDHHTPGAAEAIVRSCTTLKNDVQVGPDCFGRRCKKQPVQRQRPRIR